MLPTIIINVITCQYVDNIVNNCHYIANLITCHYAFKLITCHDVANLTCRCVANLITCFYVANLIVHFTGSSRCNRSLHLQPVDTRT